MLKKADDTWINVAHRPSVIGEWGVSSVLCGVFVTA